AAALLFFAVETVSGVGREPLAPAALKILLTITLLPLGLTAPFGTTILGWIAVGDIRRAKGRISGLPLALFDGLLFPLLGLDVFLVFGPFEAIYWQMDASFHLAVSHLSRSL